MQTRKKMSKGSFLCFSSILMSYYCFYDNFHWFEQIFLFLWVFELTGIYRVATNLEKWKTWKTQGIWKIFRISGKTQGNLNYCRKTWKTHGKCEICDIIANESVFQRIFLSWVAQRKIWKWPGNLRNSGDLVSRKCGHPVFNHRTVVSS